MPDDRSPLWLWPVHRWFWMWDQIIPSIYRVMAVVVAAAMTSFVVIAATDLWWWAVVLPALAGWAGIAILQEHDERVHLSVDVDFERELRARLDQLLSGRGYAPLQSNGPCRARPERTDSFTYGGGGPDDETIFIYRDRAGGMIEVSGPGSTVDIVSSGDAAQDAAAVTSIVREQFEP